MRTLRDHFYACACVLTLVGCASTRPDESVTASNLAVDVALTDADQAPFMLSKFRGKPTLVFFFATYDSASQLALGHVEHYLVHEKRIQTLGIALQPDAREFLVPYRDALSVDFPLSFDPANSILKGTSDFGEIPSVPTFIMLDAGGHVTARHIGVADDDELEDLISSAL